MATAAVASTAGPGLCLPQFLFPLVAAEASKERRSRSSTESDAPLLSPLLAPFAREAAPHTDGGGHAAQEGVDEEKGELLVPHDCRELLPTSVGGRLAAMENPSHRDSTDTGDTESC